MPDRTGTRLIGNSKNNGVDGQWAIRLLGSAPLEHIWAEMLAVTRRSSLGIFDFDSDVEELFEFHSSSFPD